MTSSTMEDHGAGFFLSEVDDTVLYMDSDGNEYHPNPLLDPEVADEMEIPYVQCDQGIYYYQGEATWQLASSSFSSGQVDSHDQDTEVQPHNDSSLGGLEKEDTTPITQTNAPSSPSRTDTRENNDGSAVPADRSSRSPNKRNQREGRRRRRHRSNSARNLMEKEERSPSRSPSKPPRTSPSRSDGATKTRQPKRHSYMVQLQEQDKPAPAFQRQRSRSITSRSPMERADRGTKTSYPTKRSYSKGRSLSSRDLMEKVDEATKISNPMEKSCSAGSLLELYHGTGRTAHSTKASSRSQAARSLMGKVEGATKTRHSKGHTDSKQDRPTKTGRSQRPRSLSSRNLMEKMDQEIKSGNPMGKSCSAGTLNLLPQRGHRTGKTSHSKNSRSQAARSLMERIDGASKTSGHSKGHSYTVRQLEEQDGATKVVRPRKTRSRSARHLVAKGDGATKTLSPDSRRPDEGRRSSPRRNQGADHASNKESERRPKSHDDHIRRHLKRQQLRQRDEEEKANARRIKELEGMLVELGEQLERKKEVEAEAGDHAETEREELKKHSLGGHLLDQISSGGKALVGLASMVANATA